MRYSPRSLVLGAGLLPVAASGSEGLAQHGDLRAGQGISVFVSHAAFDDRSGLQANQEVFELLPSRQGQHAALGTGAVLVDFEIAAALGEEVIAPGRDAIDAERAVGAGDGGVISAFALVLGNQLDQGLLHRLAAGVFGDQACDHGSGGVGGHGLGGPVLWERALGQRGAGKDEDQDGCESRVHSVADRNIWELFVIRPGGSTATMQSVFYPEKDFPKAVLWPPPWRASRA